MSRLVLYNTKKILSLIISDNGIGHDMSLKSDGVGIINIQSRAEGYGGTAAIISNPKRFCIEK